MALKVYLADLIYDTIKTNYVVPLNIAYIAAYSKEQYGEDVDITLFKYPTELEKKLQEGPPDVLGLSFYSWNDRLNRHFLKAAKAKDPNIITVMGGPNTNVSYENMKAFLSAFPEIDYYVLNEGEKPFANIIEALLGENGTKHQKTAVQGCASLSDKDFHYQLIDYKGQSKEIDVPSPYLNGWLDPFLLDDNMIPLLETNRGCPYGCVYCQWGTAALSKIRTRDIELIFKEMEYIIKKSVGQKLWIFCDANFGILKRDLAIAEKIKEHRVKEGFPLSVTLWHSKNTTERNIDIAEMVGDDSEGGYIAIQSSDDEVLKLSGRGAIKSKELGVFVKHYKDRNIPVATDLLIGLPGETAQAHLQSICDAFSLGFTSINPYNIRMLDGTDYATKESREKFQVQVKYRPVFGSYGIYGGQRIFEMEESLRATKDMSETELNGFKILHWLIYFAWNSGIFKNQINIAQMHGLNGGKILHELTRSEQPVIRSFFNSFLQESMDEWFDTPEEMQEFYEKQGNFDSMVTNFAKLNFLYIAKAFQDIEIFNCLSSEIESIIQNNLSKDVGQELDETFLALRRIGELTICRNPFQKAVTHELEISRHLANVIVHQKDAFDQADKYKIKIVRSEENYQFCRNFFKDENNISINDWMRFLESGGLQILTNKIELDNSQAVYESARSNGEQYRA